MASHPDARAARPARRWAAVRLAPLAALAFLLLPLVEQMVPPAFRVTDRLEAIAIFILLGLGLHLLTGLTGVLNLGMAAFMAIGAYVFAILTCPIYPFQIGFWPGLIGATAAGTGAGALLAMPTMRLRGDYVAIVTLGFGEIVRDGLINADAITKGSQGINPVAAPSLAGTDLGADHPLGRYYLVLACVMIAAALCTALQSSALGRRFVAIREDELAAQAMGIATSRVKLGAFAACAALGALAGGLWASLQGSSIDPSYYDFQLSTVVLCIVIVGGLGRVAGVVVGALVVVGVNTILLAEASGFLARHGLTGNGLVLAAPDNWKYLLLGLALVLMMRFRPQGLMPASRPLGAAPAGATGAGTAGTTGTAGTAGTAAAGADGTRT